MKLFRWHPEAKVVGDDRSLRHALAVPGRAFRIGGVGPQPVGHGVFETLTSGSSGAPRRILRSMESWIASFAVNAGLFGIGPGVRVAVLGDLVHSLALYGALEALHLGATVQLLGGMRPDRQVLALAGAAVTYATPAQLRLLVEAGWQAQGLILVGGSKLDAKLRTALAGADIREFYGAAEASFITLAGPDAPEDSVGSVYPGVEVDVRAGQIWVRSPYLFQGYAGVDAGGAVWDAGWLSVGEMGRLEAGYLYLSGRAGRMVTVADQNVFPEEIESFIAGLPGVARVAVLPRRDALRGAVMVAVLLGDAAAEVAILTACRVRLGSLVAPKAAIWVREWPLLASGKTDLVRLAREVAV
ncbi:AMP-binding protein [Cypionkella sp.]|uniref:AMP-binding protein n=1 Tax=Cypionkella sp. TaxID=2811411 RepID=UPI0026166FBF|nr:AMP-binding protein [Cypionkella sp.]